MPVYDNGIFRTIFQSEEKRIVNIFLSFSKIKVWRVSTLFAYIQNLRYNSARTYKKNIGKTDKNKIAAVAAAAAAAAGATVAAAAKS